MMSFYFKVYRSFIAFVVILFSSFSLAGQIPLSFTGTPTVTGTAGTVGAIYRYNNIGTTGPVTIRGDIQILAISGTAALQNIDATTGGSANAWQPVINGTTTASGSCWSIEFSLSFYDATTGLPITLSSFRSSGIDIDGDGGTLREFNEFRAPTSYTVENPTSLTLTKTGTAYSFASPQTQYTGILLTQTNVAVTVLYNSRSSVTMRLGSCCVGGTCSATGTNRQYSINFFDAVAYSNGMTVLPVNFIALSGQTLPGGNKISWQVAAETELAGYEVERSVDGESFTNIGFIPYRYTPLPKNEYSYTDPYSGHEAFYRIKSVDIDGRSKYSKTIKITGGTDKGSLRVFENPVRNSLILEFISPASQQLQLKIISLTGQILQTKSIRVEKGTSILQYDDIRLPGRGVYMLSITDEHSRQYFAKLLKE